MEDSADHHAGELVGAEGKDMELGQAGRGQREQVCSRILDVLEDGRRNCSLKGYCDG